VVVATGDPLASKCTSNDSVLIQEANTSFHNDHFNGLIPSANLPTHFLKFQARLLR
jgi:hypothetical protein